ncbi:thiol reductant ABC exporter subunit CydC [Hyphomicrobium sp. MC8b]|uniref:thiol reductant ABC exporter subunit CydC n=1 Tax=Hyphomicrobium sp. MC8b TaxID=300273 RepID=UPI00391AFF31
MSRVSRDLAPILSLFWRGPRGKLLFGLGLSAATTLCGLALLGLSGWFITATAIAGLSAATALAFDVFSPSAGIRFFALARTVSRYGERLVTHDATLSILAELRERLFRGSAAMREAEKLRMRPAALLFRLTHDIDALDSLYLRMVVPAAAAIAAALAIGLCFGAILPAAGIGFGAFLVIAGLGIPLIAARVAERPAQRRVLALEALRSRVIDLVSGQTDLVMSGRIEAQRRAIAEADRKLSDADSELNLAEVASGAALGIVSATLIASALFVTLLLARHAEIGAPIMALAVLVTIAALEPFSALRRGAIELGRTCVAARRVAVRLEPPAYASVASPPSGIACVLDAVSVHYGHADRPAIQNITLSLRVGERVALIGSSGSGKSTLIFVIAGELAPDHGSVRSVPSTLLTQRTELFTDTLRDNLRLANATADDDCLRRAMMSAGLKPYLDALPNGLDTRLGEDGLGLSGGEGRRLALARLFLRETPLWLLDEPTEGLDDATARDVLGRLSANAAQCTLLIATHIRREAEIADRLIAMKDGRVIGQASRGDSQFEALLSTLRQD